MENLAYLGNDFKHYANLGKYTQHPSYSFGLHDGYDRSKSNSNMTFYHIPMKSPMK